MSKIEQKADILVQKNFKNKEISWKEELSHHCILELKQGLGDMGPWAPTTAVR